MTDNALILCADSAFFPLARGTVLSLRRLFPSDAPFDLCFLDIGLEDAQRAWLTAQGVIVKSFDDVKIFNKLPPAFKNYNKSQVIRPFLPRIFAGYAIYMWADTDIWFQTPEAVTDFFDYARDHAPKIAIVPTIDTSYQFNYAHYRDENYGRFMGLVKMWYEAGYDEKTSIDMYGRALFSSGLFALHKDSPIWDLWAAQFKIAFNRDYRDKMWALHLIEQCALNKVIYETGDFVPLNARFNYNCHIGRLKRDAASGRVVIDYPPYDTIHAVHLTYSSKFMPHYLERGLLYDSGNYLTDAERAALRGLNHYQ